MERANENLNKQPRPKSASPRRVRGRRPVTINDFTSCNSPFCQYIAEKRTLRRSLWFAQCCKTLLSSREGVQLSHPEEHIRDLFQLIAIRGCSDHEAFHQFLANKGHRLKIEMPHFEQSEVDLFSSRNKQKNLYTKLTYR